MKTAVTIRRRAGMDPAVAFVPGARLSKAAALTDGDRASNLPSVPACSTRCGSGEPRAARIGTSAFGFNTLDLMIVIACLALGLLVWVLPALNRPKARVTRIQCVSNLKQVGLGLRVWSNDHQDRFPMSVSTNEGGTREFDQGRLTYMHFLNLSNELGNPKILRCREDAPRLRAFGWQQFVTNGNRALSYFAGLDAGETCSVEILTGDRNITAPRETNGVLFVQASSELNSIQGAHEKSLNLGLTDGSVAQLNGAASTPASSLHRAVSNALDARTNMPFRLSLPVTP